MPLRLLLPLTLVPRYSLLTIQMLLFAEGVYVRSLLVLSETTLLVETKVVDIGKRPTMLAAVDELPSVPPLLVGIKPTPLLVVGCRE